MGVQAIEGGYDTTHTSAAVRDQQRRANQRTAAYRNLTAIACNQVLGPGWEHNGTPDPAKVREARALRDELAAALGIDPQGVTR